MQSHRKIEITKPTAMRERDLIRNNEMLKINKGRDNQSREEQQ